MLIFIIYMLVAAMCFSGYIVSMDTIYRKSYQHNDGDNIFYGVLLSVFWIVTVWFVFPYILINLSKCRKDN